MFYKFICLCWVVSCVIAAPPKRAAQEPAPTVIPIVSQSDELEPNGTYRFSYETGNGIKREEVSYDKVLPKGKSSPESSNEGGESDESDEIHVQRGSYSYTAPDGTLITVRYIADENGFQPIGDHIPRVPVAAPADANSGEKTGRALKHHSSSEAKSPPAVASRLGESDSSESKDTKKTNSEPVPIAKNAAEVKAPKSVSNEASSNESDGIKSEGTTESASIAASTDNGNLEASSTTSSEQSTTVSETSTTEASDLSSTTAAEVTSTATSEESTSEAGSTVATDLSTIPASEPTTTNVSETVSTTVSDMSTTSADQSSESRSESSTTEMPSTTTVAA